MKVMLRRSLATLVGSLALFATSAALAEGEGCYNDVDCPGTACGDAVCNWSKQTTAPMGNKIFYCNPAGTQAEGRDGWCTTTADCKCAGEGATCVGTYCTFTKPKGGSTGGATSTGGASSTGGTTGGTEPGTGGTAPSTGGTAPSTGGTTSTGGTATGGTPTDTTTNTGTGTGTGTAPPDNSGGCTVSAPGRSHGGLALALGLLGLGVARARRRR